MNPILPCFDWICEASLRASLLAAAILVLQVGIRKFLSPQGRYVMWLPLIVVLTMPVLPRSRWSVETALAERAPISAPVSLASAAQNLPEGRLAAPEIKGFKGGWKETAALVWVAGVAVTLGGCQGLYLRTMRRVVTTAQPVDRSLENTIRVLSAELGLRQAPQIVCSPAVEGPAVTGLLRPILLLPANFSALFSEAEAAMVLKHELMHIKRFDLEINALACLLNALHWFNPVLWFVAALARRDREAACDAGVLGRELSDSRNLYGNALLKVHSIAPEQLLRLGFIGIFEGSLRSRIEAVIGYKRPRPINGIVAGLIVFLLCMAGGTRAQTSQPVPAASHESKGPETGPANRATQSIQHKLDHILIPKVEFKDSTLPEAVNALVQKSREFDQLETDPAKKGVNIMIFSPNSAAEFSNGPRITLSLHDVSLGEALKYLATLAGEKVKLDPYAVELLPLSQNGNGGAAHH